MINHKVIGDVFSWISMSMRLPGKFLAFQTIMVLSTLQEANHTSLADQAKSSTSVMRKQDINILRAYSHDI